MASGYGHPRSSFPQTPQLPIPPGDPQRLTRRCASEWNPPVSTGQPSPTIHHPDPLALKSAISNSPRLPPLANVECPLIRPSLAKDCCGCTARPLAIELPSHSMSPRPKSEQYAETSCWATTPSRPRRPTWSEPSTDTRCWAGCSTITIEKPHETRVKRAMPDILDRGREGADSRHTQLWTTSRYTQF
jgi:hypothetical protein